MLKYACHNNNGKIELIRCASFLGKSVKIVEKLLELYSKAGFIDIIDKNSSFYTIEMFEIDDIGKVLHTEEYAQIFEMMMECEEFQKSLLEDELEHVLLEV